MYKPHSSIGLLEAPIFFRGEHSNQYGISLRDAMRPGLKNLAKSDQAVFDGSDDTRISIRLEVSRYCSIFIISHLFSLVAGLREVEQLDPNKGLP